MSELSRKGGASVTDATLPVPMPSQAERQIAALEAARRARRRAEPMPERSLFDDTHRQQQDLF